MHRGHKNHKNQQEMTAEEELIIIKRAQNGDKKAIDRLTRSNLSLLKNCAKYYGIGLKPGQTLEDIEQTGAIGLFNAIKKFDPKFKNRFKTFAKPCIENAMKNPPHDQLWDYKRFPKKSSIAKVIKAKQQLEEKINGEPTDEEIARKAGLEIEVVRAILIEVLTSARYPEELLPEMEMNISEEVSGSGWQNPERQLQREEFKLICSKLGLSEDNDSNMLFALDCKYGTPSLRRIEVNKLVKKDYGNVVCILSRYAGNPYTKRRLILQFEEFFNNSE